MNYTDDNFIPDRICVSHTFLSFQNITDHIFFVFSAFGSVFNLLVIYFALKLFRQKEETIHLFVISMTLGDLMLTMFSYPVENLFRININFMENYFYLCAPAHFFTWLGLAVSGFSLVFLNVDKLIFFWWPLSYDRFMSKRKASLLCLFIWSISLGFVCYAWIFRVVYVKNVADDCVLQMSDPKIKAYKFFIVVFCVFPIVSALFLSLYLFYLTRKGFSGRVIIVTNSTKENFKKKLKSLVFIFSTTAWTSFSLLPYRIFCLSRIYFFNWDKIECEEEKMISWMAWSLLYLLMSNSIINPLITVLIYKPYKRELKGILRLN